MVKTLTTEVQERAQTALAESPIYALRFLRVKQHGEALTISGRVSTFYYKQLAQEIVRHVSDGAVLINDIAVDD